MGHPHPHSPDMDAASHQEILLAYGIVEYQITLDHLRALRGSGVNVPYVVLGRLQTEQTLLIRHWLASHGDPLLDRHPALVAQEVRTWLNEHLVELDAFLGEEQGLNNHD